MKSISRRYFVATGIAASILAVLPLPVRAAIRLAKSKFLEDASKLLKLPVHKHLIVESAGEDELIAALRRELKEAASENRPVAVSAARHSMGGQSLPKNGVAITFENPGLEIDKAAKICRVNAGTRWFQAIKELDRQGFSPAVMQSNSDFGVGSTFCVNAHGWPVPYGPFGSTVRAIRLMLHDGTILRCSRDENSELFQLSMGGYGLFGIILDLEIDIVENLLLKPEIVKMPAEKFAEYFIQQAEDPQVNMAYGRLEVARESFFREAVAISYRAEPASGEELPKVEDGGIVSFLSRKIYRAQIGSEWAKRQRWRIESGIAPSLTSGIATRNTLMAEPVANLASSDKDRTDILHEYFVPPENFTQFVEACRRIIPPSPLEFLNVTLRYVKADEESVLSFAPTRRIAAVMSFSQRRRENADESEMRRVTEALINAAHEGGGSFYLPYRLHATPEQLTKIYPQIDRFAARKRHYDPGLLFRNLMWDIYFSGR